VTVALDIGERILPSGLTLIAVRNPGVATFACDVSLLVSLRDEGAGEHGAAHLVGQCLEEGTRSRDGAAFAEAVEALGAHITGSTGGGAVQCPASESSKAVGLLRELVIEPAFPAKAVARVREEVLTEIKADGDDARMVARRRFRKLVYGRHPYGRPAYGTARSVAELRPADLRRWHRQWFVPHGGYVAASGPDPVEKTLDMLARHWRGFEGREVEHRKMPEVGMPAEPVVEHRSMKREQVHVFVGHVGVRRADPDYIPLQVMDHVLGSGPGFTSRISKRLRDEDGLCYSVAAGMTSSAGTQPGIFAAYMGTKAEHRQRAVDGFLQEIRKIRREPPSAEELRDVQEYLTGSYVFGLERNSALAAYAIRAKRFELGFDFIERYPDLVRAVTAEDVQRVAHRHLQPKRMHIVSAGAGD